ncbi:hypothetical protein Vadar_007929 [Vaccinium darrowii]|uniref:Uncharacterized protein n=1 Tax=Vaccinium darrowii TaxID=229202 RepID=A0ACB7Z3A1_9ERIC|nr:hypothetical protein Vadar_007929 [Vaccinium darrowii]
MANIEKSKLKILVFGATGYLGNYMVKASLSMGHPTYVYVRPINPNSTCPNSKLHLHRQFLSSGVSIFQGELDDHEKLVAAVREVDVVISTLAVPQHLAQLNIIAAMKEAGNIKRFVPSEYGNDVDRVRGLPPFQALLDNKKKMRRATEAAGIPYTYISANAFAAYFVDYLLHPHEMRDEVTIYGSGEAKDSIFLSDINSFESLEVYPVFTFKADD